MRSDWDTHKEVLAFECTCLPVSRSFNCFWLYSFFFFLARKSGEMEPLIYSICNLFLIFLFFPVVKGCIQRTTLCTRAQMQHVVTLIHRIKLPCCLMASAFHYCGGIRVVLLRNGQGSFSHYYVGDDSFADDIRDVGKISYLVFKCHLLDGFFFPPSWCIGIHLGNFVINLSLVVWHFFCPSAVFLIMKLLSVRQTYMHLKLFWDFEVDN